MNTDAYEHEMSKLQDETDELVAFIERAAAAAQDAGMGDLAYDLDSLADKVHDDNHDRATKWADEVAEEGEWE